MASGFEDAGLGAAWMGLLGHYERDIVEADPPRILRSTSDTQSVPHKTCGQRLAREVVTWNDMTRMQRMGLR